jgi:hypothetical protein
VRPRQFYLPPGFSSSGQFYRQIGGALDVEASTVRENLARAA